MSAEISSRPYQPNPDVCCERCVFGSGEHSEWCLDGRAERMELQLRAMGVETPTKLQAFMQRQQPFMDKLRYDSLAALDRVLYGKLAQRLSKGDVERGRDADRDKG